MIDLELKTPDPFSGIKDFLDRIERPGVGERRKIADSIRQGFQASFTREGSRAGQWRALAPSTVLDRRRRGFAGDHPILVRSGSLRASFVDGGNSAHNEEFQAQPNGWRLVAGSNHPLAPFHEFGTRRMAARSITDLTDADEGRIVDVIDYLLSEMQAATVGR